MKKLIITLVAVLVFSILLIAFTEVSPASASGSAGAEMPSMLSLIWRDADEKSRTKDGSVVYLYNDISYTEISRFIKRLIETGCELESYAVRGDMHFAVVTRGEGEMRLEYDGSSSTCAVTYNPGAFPEEIKPYSVGSVVLYGEYEQDNDLTNGAEPIEWIVLDKNEAGNCLLISKYALDAEAYNEQSTDITWEHSTIRNWLNSEFYDAAFSDNEKPRVLTSRVTADIKIGYDDDPGNDTDDRVFLLSLAEVNRFFMSDTARICCPTGCALTKGLTVLDGGCRWWLRSIIDDDCLGFSAAAFVDYDGSVSEAGGPVSNELYYVRPALWVKPE